MTTAGSSTQSIPRTHTITEMVDWRALSPSSRSTLRTLGASISDGLPLTEIAKRSGLPASVVADRIKALKTELASQLGIAV
jgi:hypothetical protein